MNPAEKEPHYINSLLPNEARRTLGVIMAPDGSCTSQLKVSIAKAKKFNGKSSNAFMSSKAKWIAITTIIETALLYLIVTTSFTDKDILPLDSLTTRMKCLALGLNRNFPRAILHGTSLLGGIGIPSSSQNNTKDRNNYFLYNLWHDTSLSYQFNISITYTQIEIGTFTQFFTLPYSTYGHLATTSYCTQLWRELEPKGLLLQPFANTTCTP